MAESNYDKQIREVHDYIREQNAERRRQEAAQRREEKAQAARERKAARSRNRNTSGQKTPWIVRFDNALHDALGAPRNYDID